MTKQPQQPETHVNEALKKDLKALYHDPRPLPESLDRRVLERFPLPAPAVMRTRLLRRVLAIAAVIVIGVGVIGILWHRSLPASPAATADLDHNGRVDILDAFWLARRLEARQPVQAQWDLNSDGRIDQSDVQLVAQLAVRLEPKEVL